MFKEWNKERIEQKKLSEEIKSNPTMCSCGFPIPPQNIHIVEGIGYTRVYRKLSWVCSRCGNEYDIIA